MTIHVELKPDADPNTGDAAARAYATLATVKEKIKRVVVLGPAHRVALEGIALSEHSHFATPPGRIVLDWHSMARLKTLPQV